MQGTNKIYPTSTSEIAKIFGIDLSMTEQNTSTFGAGSFPSNLPVVEGQLLSDPETEVIKPEAPAPKDIPQDVSQEVPVPKTNLAVPKPPMREEVIHEASNEALPEMEADKKVQPVWLKVLKTVLPYLAVFAVGLALYYYYFSSFSFLDLFKNTNTTTKVNSTQQTAAVTTLEKADSAKYYAFMGQFFFDANSSVIDPNNDISGNGLTNFQKYLLNLNPKVYSTSGNGMPDGQAIILGLNPVTGKPLSDEQKKIVDNYFDLENISNQLALGSINRTNGNIPTNSEVLGASQMIPTGGQTGQTQNYGQAGFAPQGVPSNQSYSAPQTGTQYRAPASNSSGNSFGSAMANSGDNSLGINQGIPGTLTIPTLNVTVPVIWTGDTKQFDNDLKKGVVHYPGTALPGSIGTAYISGHSSSTILNRSAYSKVFDHLNNLKDGGSFTITVTLSNGKKAILHYIVDHRGTFGPTDQAQFVNTSDSVVALSTCWPVGTAKDRLVLFGKLTQVEQ